MTDLKARILQEERKIGNIRFSAILGKGERVFAAFRGEKPVAILHLHDEGNKAASITWIGTHPDYRRQGIMKELWEKVFQEIRQDYKTLYTRLPSLYLAYVKNGFRPYFPFVDFRNFPELLLKMNLVKK
jgi:GNAT superfamily N-acetyltransferase